jgi:hypothetical protein
MQQTELERQEQKSTPLSTATESFRVARRDFVASYFSIPKATAKIDRQFGRIKTHPSCPKLLLPTPVFCRRRVSGRLKCLKQKWHHNGSAVLNCCRTTARVERPVIDDEFNPTNYSF